MIMEEKKIIKKLGRERVYAHEKGKILVGTINVKNCKTIFVRLETWLTPQESLFDSVDKIRRRIKANMRVFGPTYFENDYGSYMIDVDFNQTKGKDKPGKKSFIAIEVTISANKTFEFNSDLLFVAKNFGDTLFSLLETLSEDFDISPSKK
jgi:hypothetical protein